MQFSSLIFLLIAMLSIQSGAALAKQLFPLVGSLGVTVLRTSIAAVILVSIFRPWRDSWNLSQVKKVALYGVSLGLMNLLFYQAIQTIPLGIAVALEFTGPLAVAILSSRRALDFMWVVLAALGIYFILPMTDLAAPLDIQGVLYALGAGGFWALYIIFGKRAGQDSHGGKIASVGMVFAALSTLPFGIYEAGSKILSWQVLFLGVAVAILSSALPYSLEMMALKKIPVRVFGILMSLEPVLAAVAGAVFLKEYLSMNQTVAIACIVLASLGSSLTSRES